MFLLSFFLSMTREIEKLHKGHLNELQVTKEALSKTETELKEQTAFLVTENEKLKTSIKNMHEVCSVKSINN